MAADENSGHSLVTVITPVPAGGDAFDADTASKEGLDDGWKEDGVYPSEVLFRVVTLYGKRLWGTRIDNTEVV